MCTLFRTLILLFLWKKFLEDINPFSGATDSPFWASGNICPGLQSQGGFPCLGALSPGCNGFLRFRSGVTPADLLVASMVAKPFWTTYLHTSIGVAQAQDWVCLCLTTCDKTGALRHTSSLISFQTWPYWSQLRVTRKAILQQRNLLPLHKSMCQADPPREILQWEYTFYPVSCMIRTVNSWLHIGLRNNLVITFYWNNM